MRGRWGWGLGGRVVVWCLGGLGRGGGVGVKGGAVSWAWLEDGRDWIGLDWAVLAGIGGEDGGWWDGFVSAGVGGLGSFDLLVESAHDDYCERAVQRVIVDCWAQKNDTVATTSGIQRSTSPSDRAAAMQACTYTNGCIIFSTK